MNGSADAISAESLLRLDDLGDGRFRAAHNLENGRGTIFGGQPLLQGLAAATATAPDWPVNSLTGHYLRAGSVKEPMEYRVETMRDGRRFASRRVVAWQGGKPIFDMLCSFHDPEGGPGHVAAVAPPSPPPGELEPLVDFIRRERDRLPAEMVAAAEQPFPIELRLIDPAATLLHPMEEARRRYWFRTPSAATVTDPRDHQAVLAFMTDFWFAGTPAGLHYSAHQGMRASIVTLNHSLWFHAPLRADGWLLFDTDSPWAGEGRGLAHGHIFDEGGRLVATVMQEISMRPL